jgi:phosphoenolpyruvate carboxykinase (GTP)
MKTFSDDVTWLRRGTDGRIRALNPEPANVEDAEGVPIDAIVFGTRRARVVPLICEATGWDHGCYLGATLLSELPHGGGELRWDPMGMRSFCGANLNEYLAQWLSLGRGSRSIPRVYLVNWHRRGAGGALLWPGFNENTRVLRWIVSRLEGHGPAQPTVAGFVPTADALDMGAMSVPKEARNELLDVDGREWQDEVRRQWDVIADLSCGLPLELRREHAVVANRVAESLRRYVAHPE